MSVTAIDDQQRMAALGLANEMRSRRSRIKRGIAAGEIDIFELLSEYPTPDCLENLKVRELLLSMPRVGEVKVARWLSLAGLPAMKRLGGLTARQRRVLALVIRGGVPCDDWGAA
ncbi:MAG: hypothetical protein NVS3B21_31620 [Acidimicrobiales bacterium]